MTPATEPTQAVPTGAAFLLPRKVHEMTTPRTIIEFIEPVRDTEGALCHKAKEVRVNGVPVLVKEGGIDITFGPEELTTVTLELLATEIHFRAAEPFEEGKPRNPKKRKDGPHGLIERFTGYEPTQDDYALGGPKK